jgi:hypothetical protein
LFAHKLERRLAHVCCNDRTQRNDCDSRSATILRARRTAAAVRLARGGSATLAGGPPRPESCAKDCGTSVSQFVAGTPTS